VARRDTLTKEIVESGNVVTYVHELMNVIQDNLLNKAKTFTTENTNQANTWEEFKALIKQGGFVEAHWDGTAETENKIKELTKATIRCIPIDQPAEDGVCILTGNPSTKRVLFAKAY
jgi:prolyl-tRNA synthetase